MSRALALALAIVVLALLLAIPHADTQAQNQVEVKTRWVAYINPTDGKDFASGVCVFGDYIVVVGAAELHKPYVALLRKSDGGVVREWTGSEWEVFYDCISIGGKLYVIGDTHVGSLYGVIYVFDENLNVLAKVRSERPSGYSSLAYDSKALYVGGWTYGYAYGEEWIWIVEKRALDVSISSVKSKKIHFDSWTRGWINDIGVDPSTGRVWAVGWYQDLGYGYHSLIVILDSDLRELKVIDYPQGSEEYLGAFNGIAFNGRYVYISGSEGVAKFTVDGELVAINRDGKARDKIVYGYNYLYIFGGDRIEGYDRPVLYIHDTDLNLVKSYVLGENINALSDFYIGRPVLEGNNIYVAGYDYALGERNSRVVVHSLSIEGVTVTTETGTEATTATITVSDRALTQLIVAGLAAVGVVLAIALLLLRRRR